MSWSIVTIPPEALPPRPLTMRAQTIPPRHHFAEHAHEWHQLVYAIDGVLTVSTAGRTFVISPDQAAWLPTGVRHRVGSLAGAQVRSLWVAAEAGDDLPSEPAVLAVSPLLQALIIEAAAIDGLPDADGYGGRLVRLILDQLRRAPRLASALPWPRDGRLATLCEALYLDPADDRSADIWARVLGMSARTLARRFEAELGIPLRTWRRRLRLFRAIELLGGGLSVTETALALGYGSASAFIFAFKAEMGASPLAYGRQNMKPLPPVSAAMPASGEADPTPARPVRWGI